ncbi:MAG: hemerythrin cation binding domain protein [Ilumatobacteraceae bacterium]|nr:hemerythrin cation binding domain protein [Ilumatobacteraceae bacterium]
MSNTQHNEPEMIGFELTHATFRNELPRLAAAFDNDSDDPVDPITEDHLRLVTEHLHRHHDEEETFHFRLLSERDDASADVLRQMEAQHETLQGLLSAACDVRRSRLVRAIALRTLVEATIRHLDTEDAEIVPKLRQTITADEQTDSMARSRAKIPAADELRVLALMLAAAGPQQLERMLAVLPGEVIERWRTDAAPALDAVHDHLDRTAVAAPGAHQ